MWVGGWGFYLVATLKNESHVASKMSTFGHNHLMHHHQKSELTHKKSVIFNTQYSRLCMT